MSLNAFAHSLVLAVCQRSSFVVRKRSAVKNVCKYVRPPKYHSLFRIGGTHTLAHRLRSSQPPKAMKHFIPLRSIPCGGHLVVARLAFAHKELPPHAGIVIL